MKLPLIGKLTGRDQRLAETRYQGRESASDKAARQRRQGHRRHLTAAAREGQEWEDRGRARERGGPR